MASPFNELPTFQRTVADVIVNLFVSAVADNAMNSMQSAMRLRRSSKQIHHKLDTFRFAVDVVLVLATIRIRTRRRFDNGCVQLLQ